MSIIIGILIPLLGTSIGSSFVFFLKNKLNDNINKIIIGFSIGIMLSSSFFSLLIPSIDLCNNSNVPFILPSIGFILGFVLLYLINKISVNDMLTFSVTIHNIPEGMAVGVCYAGVISNTIPIETALMLSLAIALQNIPEGSIISMPYRIKGYSRKISFIYGFLSGIVEPIFSLMTILLTNIIVPILPVLLSLAAGAMIYVIFDELILEIHKDNNSFLGLLGILLGFIIMMILDIAIS